MSIETLFDPKKDIHRTIEKVITFGTAQEERLRAEISEYEVTETIDDHLIDITAQGCVGVVGKAK